MSPDQALAILDQAAAIAPLPRQQHAMAQQAAQVVSQALERLRALESAASASETKKND
jgi:hypothetical protein